MLTRKIVHNEPGLQEFVGTIQTDVAGDVASFNIPGGVVTAITHPGTGLYTFTFSRAYAALLGVSVAIGKPSDAGISKYQIADDAMTTAGEFQLAFYNDSSPAALADPTESTLYVQINVDAVSN